MEAALNSNRNHRARSGRSPASRSAGRAQDKHAHKRYAERAAVSLTARRRWQCELFQLWRDCTRDGCRRARSCSGDPVTCVEQRWPLLPEEIQVWYRAAITALAAGASPQAADAAGCAAALSHAQAAQSPPCPAAPSALSPGSDAPSPAASAAPRLRTL